jgi:hypothetical protein
MRVSPSCDSVYLSISGYLVVPRVVVRSDVCVWRLFALSVVGWPLVMCRDRFSHNTELPPVLYMGLFDTVAAVGVPTVNDGVQAG